MAKGKVVHRWVAGVPDELGETRHEKLPISLTVGDGMFHIPLPQHLVDFLGRHPTWPDHLQRGHERTPFYSHVDAEVLAGSMVGAQARYGDVVKFFQDSVRDAQRRKVLIVRFDAQASEDKQRRHGTFNNDAPRMSLTYSIMWEMAGKLYRVFEGTDGDLPRMTYMMAAPTSPNPNDKFAVQVAQVNRKTTHMLDWTEEREAFFAQMVTAMNTLIGRVDALLGEGVEARIDNLIANGGGLLALPAPEADDVAV